MKTIKDIIILEITRHNADMQLEWAEHIAQEIMDALAENFYFITKIDK